MKRYFEPIVLAFVGWVLFVYFVVVSVAFLLIDADCMAYGQATGRLTKTHMLSCYASVNGEWFRLDQIRAFGGEK